MIKVFHKYSSIGQFRNALKCMAYHNIDELTYIGTTKLHGTNAAIRFTRGANDNTAVSFQSRNRIITIEDDNAGFANYMQTLVNDETIVSILPEEVYGNLVVWGYVDEVVVYGEWAGNGIMKGVGINALPEKSFFIFDVKVDGKFLSSEDVAKFGLQMQKYNTYNIYSFPTFFQKVDANKPKAAQEVFAALTQKVEDECPVAYALCDNNDKKVGEGIVWKPINNEWRQIADLCFKTKGDKHSASKVKTIAEVTPEMLERESKVKDFVDLVITENRLQQGVDYLKEMGLPFDKPSIGHFLKWIGQDIWKEEQDTAEANGIERKDFGGAVNKKAKDWFFKQLDLDYEK